MKMKHRSKNISFSILVLANQVVGAKDFGQSGTLEQQSGIACGFGLWQVSIYEERLVNAAVHAAHR
jgi:hypothetical protein